MLKNSNIIKEEYSQHLLTIKTLADFNLHVDKYFKFKL